MVFHSLTEAMVLIFPTFYAHDGRADLAVAARFQLQCRRMGRIYRPVWHRVETGVVMVVYLHESLDKRIASGRPLTDVDIYEALKVLCSDSGQN